MATATIQFTQGFTVGVPGRSVLGFAPDSDVTLVDAGGPGATSYLWEIISWPSPDSAPPTLTSPTLDTTDVINPFTDGVFIVKLTRDDPVDGLTTDIKFFGVGDADGLSLPSAGMTRVMANIDGTVSEPFGWAGGATGSSNVLLDAFLRKRRLREGRYVGRTEANTYTSGGSGGRFLTYGEDATNQEITLAAGSGVFTIYLTTGYLEEDGSFYRLLVTVENGASGFRLNLEGTDALAAPLPVGLQTSLTTEFLCRYVTGTGWTATSRLVSPRVDPKKDLQATTQLVAGHFAAGLTWTRIGCVVLNPLAYPLGQAWLKAVLQTTSVSAEAAELRLVRLNTALPTPVTSSLLTSISETPEELEVELTLGALDDQVTTGPAPYEVQLRLNSGDPMTIAQAFCSWALVEYRWGENIEVGGILNPACPADTYPASEIDISTLSLPGDFVTESGDIQASSPAAVARIAEDGAGYKCNYFYFTVAPGQEGVYQIDMTDTTPGGTLDTYLYLKDGPCSYDVILDSDDDGGPATDSRITAPLTAGTYSIECASFDTFLDGGEGTFDVTITFTGV